MYEFCDDFFVLVDVLLVDKVNFVEWCLKFCLEVGCGSGYVIILLVLIFVDECYV